MHLSAYDCSLHQVAAELANLPVGWATADATTAGCHRKDTSCSRRPLSTQDEKDAKRRWWLPHATHSVWLASHQLRRRGSTEGGVGGAAADCAAAAPAGQPRHDTQLVLWTQLTPPTAASVDAAGSQSGGGGAGGGASTLPFLPFPTVPTAPPSLPPIPTPTLAALPREAVGRLCGARMQVDPSWLRRAPPMDCAVLGGAIGSFFGQAVLHMQFTHADTRRAILEALHWWKAPTAATSVASSVASSSSAIAHTRVAPYPFSPSPPPSPPEASSSANPAQFGSSKVKPSMSTEKLQFSSVGPTQGDPNLASPQDPNLASQQDSLFSRAVAVAMPTSSSRGTLPQLPAPPTQLMLDAKGRGKEGAVSGNGGSLTSTPKREADLAENSTSLAENSQKKKGKLMSFGKSLFIPSSTSTEIPSGPSSSSRRPSSEHFSESEIVPFSASAALQKFIEKHGAYPMMTLNDLERPRMASDSLGRLLINHRESH